MRPPRLIIENFAQIERVDIEFGDLTVLVGAQGTGKSLALQWLKLAVDEPEISAALRDAGFVLESRADALDAFFGEGMRSAWQTSTKVAFDRKPVHITNLMRKNSRKAKAAWAQPALFFVPAHRALLLAEGWPAPFMKLGADTPVVARLFSQALYEQLSRPRTNIVFPQERVLAEDIRKRIDASVFHGGAMRLETQGLRRRLELSYGDDAGLPFMTWTAGQREFAPLLLGLYSVLPPRRKTKIEGLDWVVVEEPEMGLHPRAVATVMILIIDLLSRGYRVVLSTHSSVVLDVVWAMRAFKEAGAPVTALASALEISSQQAVGKLKKALEKTFRVFYLVHDQDNRVSSQDISSLDPAADSQAESEWGGLTQFATSLSEAVATLPEDDE